ncbi:MAG: DAK2 domain-containing protein [Oscillospiraceae bacterium]
MIQEITAAVFRDMIINATAAIEQNEEQINELNVFPVPDGDTGTNMGLTMGAGAAELRKSEPESVGKVAETAANALLRGARGNSGVILSLLFRGMAKSLKGKDTAAVSDMADAMRNGVTAAYKAVMKPAEGTILTVSRLAADAAESFDGDDMELFFECVIEAAEIALADTINQNPVLKKAGVIDAGGKGYIFILHGMLRAIRGDISEMAGDKKPAAREKASFSEFETEDITFAYCTEFIVERENMKSPDVLREYLSGIGDSIVLVDDDDIIKVHVHTNEPGNVLTHALAYGSFLTIKIENMRKQHTEKVFEESAEEPAVKSAPPEKKYGVVTVCAGEGMKEVFRDLGADGIITGGQTMNPSTEDILRKIEDTPAEIVFVLPNNKNIIMAAQQCESLTEKMVVVIPSKTVPQGIASLLVMDSSLDKEALTQTMTDAIKNVHTALITYAARDSEFDGHAIRAGEYLALLENTLIGNETDFAMLLDRVTEALSSFSPEFINVFYGEDVDEAAAESTLKKIESAFPEAEASLVSGGQPVYYYIISAE